MSERKSTASKVQDKVKQVAQEDFGQARVIVSDAVRSAAYLYPFKVNGSIFGGKHKTDASRALRTFSPTVLYGVHSLRS